MFPISYSGLDGGLVIARDVFSPHPRHTGVPVKNEALDIADSDNQILGKYQSNGRRPMFQYMLMSRI